MALTVFCLVPNDAREDEMCGNPFCWHTYANHYAFRNPEHRKPRSDVDRENDFRRKALR